MGVELTWVLLLGTLKSASCGVGDTIVSASQHIPPYANTVTLDLRLLGLRY